MSSCTLIRAGVYSHLAGLDRRTAIPSLLGSQEGRNFRVEASLLPFRLLPRAWRRCWKCKRQVGEVVVIKLSNRS